MQSDGKPVLAEALLQRDFVTTRAQDYHKEWQYGEARAAFLPSSHNIFVVKPSSRDIFMKSDYSGKHGTSLLVPQMATSLIIKSPGVPIGHRSETSLINAVPTFSKLIGIDPPRDCLGEVLPLAPP